MRLPLGVLLLIAVSSGGATAAQQEPRPRLVVLTDISSLTPGVAEPDDGQSLIRLMLYANELDIKGLIATSNLEHGQKTRPDLIRQVVDAYETVRPNLSRHAPGYPSGESLRGLIKAGQDVAGLRVPVESSIGDGKDTQASDWIIRVVDQPDARPVWVVVWGGSVDLAQALWRVRRDRPLPALERFVSRLRVHAIGDQDSTGPWLRDQFPALFLIVQRRAYRGMYRGGDLGLVSSEWVERHIHGRGALGALYPNYRGGDIWSATLGPVQGIKEGDTPSFLALIPNGLFDPDRLWLGGWGGRFQGERYRLTDIPDTDIDTSADPDPRMSSVYRWRTAFQNDFAARLDWCVKPLKEANHPPVVQIQGDRIRDVYPSQEITLDAQGSSDPDGDGLTFAWSIYPQDPEVVKGVTIRAGDSPTPQIEVNPTLLGKIVPVLLSVSDSGTPSLTRHGRVLMRVKGSH